MKKLRLIHLYLGCFFAPLLLLYICTGWYQTFNPNRNKTAGEQLDWVGRLRSIHVDQIWPTENAIGYSPMLFRWFIVALAIALISTVVIGIVLAFRVSRPKWPVWLSLLLGIAVPILLLALGQKR